MNAIRNWKINPVSLSLLILLLFSQCSSESNSEKKAGDYYVAAYIWPSCHDEEMSRNYLWSEGIGEWEIIKKGDQRFEGHKYT